MNRLVRGLAAASLFAVISLGGAHAVSTGHRSAELTSGPLSTSTTTAELTSGPLSTSSTLVAELTSGPLSTSTTSA